MFATRYNQALAVLIVGVLLLGTVGTTSALADNKTARLIAGIAVGALVYAALDDSKDCHDNYGYNRNPNPRYNPPAYNGGCWGGGPQSYYNEGYRDGYGDGRDRGRHEGFDRGYQRGYTNGYDNGRYDEHYTSRNRGGSYGYGYRY